MKWNWGTKIGLVFVAFVLLMITMVVKSFQTDFHLVTEDYYSEELKYQERIDQIKNANELSVKPSVEVESNEVRIRFENDFLEAKAHFYRPDNANFDKIFSIEQKELIVPNEELVSGRYTVKITWREGDKSFYHEKEVFITK